MRVAIELDDSVAWVGCPASPVAWSHSPRRHGLGGPSYRSTHPGHLSSQEIHHSTADVTVGDRRAFPQRPMLRVRSRAGWLPLVSPAPCIPSDPSVTFHAHTQSCMQDVETAVAGNRAGAHEDFRWNALRCREAPHGCSTGGALRAEPRFDDHHHTHKGRWLRIRGALFRVPSNRIAGRDPSGANDAPEVMR